MYDDIQSRPQILLSYIVYVTNYCEINEIGYFLSGTMGPGLNDRVHIYIYINFTFWTDSLSSLQALKSKLINSNTVALYHKHISKLADSNTIHIKWITAHCGHWGNEQADKIAKQGTSYHIH